jgi:signal transduction histidine kinase
MKSLSYKIGLGYFVVICINAAIAVFAVYHINRLSSPIDRILKEKYQNVSAAENMTQALLQQESTQFAMIEEKFDSSKVIIFHTCKNEFYNWHQRAVEGIALPVEPDILDSIMLVFQPYLSKSDSLHLMLGEKTTYKKVKSYHSKNIFPLIKKLNALCLKLKDVNQQAVNDADKKAKSLSKRANMVIIIFSVIAVFLSILSSIYFAKRILKPVKQTTETVRKISRGQLNQKIDITSDDEIAELGIEFNKMTERLEAYEKMNINQILLEKKKAEAIVSNIPVSIIVTDEDYRLSLMNELAIKSLNISGKDWQGKKVAEAVKDKTLAKLLSGEDNLPEKETIPKKPLISVKKDNTEFFYLTRQIKITDDDNNIMGIVTLLQDVTSFKNLDRLKSDFMSAISHEFRTPLTSINMAVDILLKEVRGKINKEQKELLAGAKEDGQRLKRFVKELLDLSKLESGNYTFDFQNTSVTELSEYAVQPLRLLLKKKKINLKMNIDSSLPAFQADFHNLSRVITNLVENSLQHTPQSGQISIEAKQENETILFCIADSGEGIPEEAVDLIFDKFIQVKNFKDAGQGNIGLGLAIAREIVKAHNGKIWVESKLGSGSKFYFQIPLA